MGNSESKDRRLFIDIVKQMLSHRGIHVKKSSLSTFFSFVQEQCPWFPDEGTVNLRIWERVGRDIRRHYDNVGPDRVPADTFSLWNLIRDALDPEHEAEKFRRETKSPDSDGEDPVTDENRENTSEGPKMSPSSSDYRSLRQMLASMAVHRYDDDSDDDVLDPRDQAELEEEAARYHRDDGGWSPVGKVVPQYLIPPLRPEKKPIRPKLPKKTIIRPADDPDPPPAKRPLSGDNNGSDITETDKTG
ncbi:endogenous retrovirus group K member 113 Gag polyprotein-like [Odocoileus virginianus]|uniref:Endogenous retrovirus group K member 113 Gag polyprotein-like n=1 Tax=Odocoileus virginianus TaxID=9874 RepID=A0ABM4J3B8_ODOVR